MSLGLFHICVRAALHAAIIATVVASVSLWVIDVVRKLWDAA